MNGQYDALRVMLGILFALEAVRNVLKGANRKACYWIALLVLIALSGCTTAKPPDVFPWEHGSRVAEGTWIALHTIDTLQTVQIAKHPQCYREANPIAAAIYGTDHPSASRVAITNVALMFVHSGVSRWFDDGVERARARGDDSVGPWYVGRIAWHAVSILGTGSAVANNFNIGLGPTSARCRP